MEAGCVMAVVGERGDELRCCSWLAWCAGENT